MRTTYNFKNIDDTIEFFRDLRSAVDVEELRAFVTTYSDDKNEAGKLVAQYEKQIAKPLDELIQKHCHGKKIVDGTMTPVEKIEYQREHGGRSHAMQLVNYFSKQNKMQGIAAQAQALITRIDEIAEAYDERMGTNAKIFPCTQHAAAIIQNLEIVDTRLSDLNFTMRDESPDTALGQLHKDLVRVEGRARQNTGGKGAAKAAGDPD